MGTKTRKDLHKNQSQLGGFKKNLQELYENIEKNPDTPAAQRMRQKPKVPDSSSVKPPESLQPDPFKGSEKVPDIKDLYGKFVKAVVIPTDIRNKEKVFKDLNFYMKEYPLSTNKFLKKQGITIAQIKDIQAKDIKERKETLAHRRRKFGITSFRPKKRGGKVLANSTRKAKYKAG